MRNLRTALYIGAAIGGLNAPTLAQAQDGDTRLSETASRTIVVTARKVEESVQEIPVAITAFSSEDIAAKSIRDLEDVALLTPGLVFEDFANGGYGTPTIRGATQFSITGLEQNVSVFIDGVYIPRQYAFDLGSTNLERIEVVKGPQSALYGANAFAGAINYITTNRSLSDLSGYAELGVSQAGGFEVSAKISVPVIEDRLAMRFGVGHSEFDGGWTNNHPDADVGIYPGTDESIGGYNKESFMIGASASPINGLTIDFDYYLFDTFSEIGATYRLERPGDTNCGFAGTGATPVYRLFCGELPNVPVPGPSGTEGLVADPRSFGLDAETRIYRAGATFELSDTLSASYLLGKIKGDVFSAGTGDRDPLFGIIPFTRNIILFGPVGNFDYETHEVRLQYEGDNGLYAMVGAFDMSGEDDDTFAFGFAPFRDLTPFAEVPAGFFKTTGTTLTDTQAIFGRVAVPLMNETVTISAEGRYTEEDKQVSGTALTYSDSYFTPRVSIDFKATPDNLLYVSVAKGVKSGGINISAFPGLIAEEQFYGADTNWTYEIGSKNSFGNGRGLLNVALFYIDWGNLQLATTPSGAPANTPSITTNLGGATSKGVEIEAQYEVVSGLSLNAGLAYIDASFKEGTKSARLTRATACDDIVCARDGDVGGNAIQRTSKWQWNVGAAYSAPISETLEVFGRVDVAGQSKQWVDESNTASIEPRVLVNTRLGLRNDHWSFSIWAKNLLDKRYVSNAFFTAVPNGTSYVPTLGNPRRIGATLAFDF